MKYVGFYIGGECNAYIIFCSLKISKFNDFVFKCKLILYYLKLSLGWYEQQAGLHRRDSHIPNRNTICSTLV